jgi:hypothetical protein
MFFSDFLKAILYSNIHDFFIFKAFESKSQYIKKNLLLERQVPYLWEIRTSISIRSKHPHGGGSHCTCLHFRPLSKGQRSFVYFSVSAVFRIKEYYENSLNRKNLIKSKSTSQEDSNFSIYKNLISFHNSNVCIIF